MCGYRKIKLIIYRRILGMFVYNIVFIVFFELIFFIETNQIFPNFF